MKQKPIKIIQITDTHLQGDPQDELLGVKTQESFQTTLRLIQEKNFEIDFILHSGDISQDDSASSYHFFIELMKGFNVPVYCLPGNHDDTKVMQTIFPDNQITLERQILVDNWQIILLNSQIPGKIEGNLGRAELEFMGRCLSEYPNAHAMIVLHHHPFPSGSEWLDQLGLKNADEFWGILARYPNVKNILFGHVHQVIEKEQQNIKCYSAPATCIQFMPYQKDFCLDNIPPGFRWIDLYPDGSIKTGVERADHYVGIFDANAKSY